MGVVDPIMLLLRAIRVKALYGRAERNEATSFAQGSCN